VNNDKRSTAAMVGGASSTATALLFVHEIAPSDDIYFLILLVVAIVTTLLFSILAARLDKIETPFDRLVSIYPIEDEKRKHSEDNMPISDITGQVGEITSDGEVYFFKDDD
jgi:hypothetical protein